MSEKANNNSLLKASLALALGFILSAVVISRAALEIKNTGQTIKIKGYAEKPISSDLAIWTGSFAVDSNSLISGYQTLEAHKDLVLTYLKNQGIDISLVTVSAVDSNTNYKLNDRGYSTNEIAGYRLTQSVTVKSENVNQINSLAGDSTRLLKQGVGFNSQMPRFYYTKLDDQKIEMLKLATEDARLRAEAIAEASGGEVGAIRSARQGVFQITAPQSTDVSDYGIYDTSSIDKVIKAVVTVEYSVY